jgi:hypothetical protein
LGDDTVSSPISVEEEVMNTSRVEIVCTIVLVAACWTCPGAVRAAQAEGPPRLPADLELREDGPQHYRVTTVWHNRDAEGKATGKYVMSGQYTRGLEGSTVRWNDVRIAVFRDPEGTEADTLFQESMENLSYKSPEEVANPMLFARLPVDETRHLLGTLIWDAVAIEAFAWTWFDKLEMNSVYRPAEFEGFTVQMAGWGTLKMQDLRLRWTGESMMNDEKCAVIQYESFVNPIQSVGMNGRSLYWGTILVSLEDKQIEHATLNEDVLIKRPPSGASSGILNIQREFTFVRVNE